MKPQRLGNVSIPDEELVKDKKECKKIGPCGIGNLGLIKLYEIFSRMCQDCRNDQYEDLDGLFAQAEANYSKVVEAIKKI